MADAPPPFSLQQRTTGETGLAFVIVHGRHCPSVHEVFDVERGAQWVRGNMALHSAEHGVLDVMESVPERSGIMLSWPIEAVFMVVQAPRRADGLRLANMLTHAACQPDQGTVPVTLGGGAGGGGVAGGQSGQSSQGGAGGSGAAQA